jgi:hypothetical protein
LALFSDEEGVAVLRIIPFAYQPLNQNQNHKSPRFAHLKFAAQNLKVQGSWDLFGIHAFVRGRFFDFVLFLLLLVAI